MSKKSGNKRWKRLKQAEFQRQRAAMGYGTSGYLDPMVRAEIMQRVEGSGKFPKPEVREFVPRPEVLAQRNNERLEQAARDEFDFQMGNVGIGYKVEDFEDQAA